MCPAEKTKDFLKMNIALFTSNHLRHKYIANQLAQNLPLKLILCEQKSDKIQDASAYQKPDQQLLEMHFAERDRSEKSFFGENQHFPQRVEAVILPFGALNSENTLALLEEHQITHILLFGTSIVKPFILNRFPEKVINLHLGLSPYYKGSGTNFFPIVNQEFECIGATFHLATEKVDAGAILHQIRPDEVSPEDTIHSLGNKVILKAGKVYPKVVELYQSQQIRLHYQNPIEHSHEYRIKDFTPSVLRQAHEVIAQGGVKKYLEKQSEKNNDKPIISGF